MSVQSPRQVQRFPFRHDQSPNFPLPPSYDTAANLLSTAPALRPLADRPGVAMACIEHAITASIGPSRFPVISDPKLTVSAPSRVRQPSLHCRATRRSQISLTP